jgi:hypothetical protein
LGFKLEHYRGAGVVTLQRRLLFYLFTTALIGAAIGALTAWYIAFRLPYWPIHPDATHMVPFNNHGTDHYMERIEGYWINNVWWIIGPAWLVIVGLKIWSHLPDRNSTQNSN